MWASDLPDKSNTEDNNVHYDVIKASGDEPGEYRVAGMGGVLLNPGSCGFQGQGLRRRLDSVWNAPTFNELRIGWVNYQCKAETKHLWMDDFAAGPARIGCPAAGAQTH